MIERQIFKVLYSPVKAFEEIVKKPSIKGPLLILALTLAATMAFQYVYASKVFIETETGRYISLATSKKFGEVITSPMISVTLSFFLNWLIYTGILSLLISPFRVQALKAGSWPVFFTILGYVFSVTIVHSLASALLLATLPALYLPMEAWNPTTAEEMATAHKITQQIYQEKWYPQVGYQLGFFLTYGIDVWTAALLAVAIRSSHGFTWTKAVTISATAFVIRFLLRTLLGL